MSDRLGPLAFGEKEGEVFLGRDYGHIKNYSESTAIVIDEEIRRIVEESYARTRDILSQHRDDLIAVSEALLERVNMDGSEIRAMIFSAEDTETAAQEESKLAEKAVAPGEGPCIEEA